MRETPRQSGGGRPRASLISKARESIEEGSKSFTAASMLFDEDTRDRAHLLYAWCRRCDDIADGQDHGGTLTLDDSDPKDRVEAIRILTHRALEGHPTADIAFDALGLVAAECRLTKEMADDVIDGFALDAAGWRPRTEGELMRYCFHVAGAVGVMMARIMGVPADDHDTLDRACDLGLAFQLNNIARDIWEDDAAGRCYIPEEWLAEADIPPGQHMKPMFRPQLVKLAARLVDLAEQHEAAARLGAARLRFRDRWAVLSAAHIYGAIGREVRERGEAAWDHRVHTTTGEKLRYLWLGLRDAMRDPEPVDPMPRWTRGELMVMARMEAPPAPMPTTPLRDEEVRPATPKPQPE
ncbi:phytoene/squalene synthase family protein [Alteraurantiacibacter aquimixticola]|uniref:phytoene/squalene synthase family protein n=1 Tax=Alteraurantiacibacter aquimixticola TaxID=2489173 RepID=UPI001FE75DF5|nr:phytoene/squalene synthase family protein [Alteraurantiacibacter aquimixticola]